MNIKLGTAVRNRDLDEEDLLFIVVEKRICEWHFPDGVSTPGPTTFEEYVIEAPSSTPDTVIQRRLRILSDTEMAELHEIDNFGYAKEFEDICNDPTGVFYVDGDNGQRTEYRRVHGVKTPYSTTVSRETLHTGDIVGMRYWDFWRSKTIEGGIVRTELLIIEMDKRTGWFRLLLGDILNPSQLAFL